MLLVSDNVCCLDIVIAENAHPAVRYAAEELQRYIERMTSEGVLPPVRTDDAQPGARQEILVGNSRRSEKVFPEVIPDGLPREGYVLKTRGKHLLVSGGSPRGTLYGVYDLLERLGVRWWTPWDEDVPRRRVLEVGPLKVTVRPPLFYRATWYRNAADADWQARMRLCAGTMGPKRLAERHGGMERFAGDRTGHTYAGLVPTERYFDEHPEYFSEVGGVRLRHNNQLCATHPDVAAIAAESAREWLRATPDARIVSVTQNDHGNWCTCKTCAAMIEREGSPAGPALHLANEVAALLEKDVPDVLVDTFAYGYTENPPKRMEAHPNVLVRIAPIGNCFGHPIRTCPVNRPCREGVKAWSKIARHLFVWHYVTDFWHYMAPFPNLPPLGDDIDFYVRHGVKGVFLQGDGTSLGGDMSELKAYLMARLMWDPSLPARDVRSEFLAGYYRRAADAVDDYVSVFEKAFASAGKDAHLFLYRSAWDNTEPYLTLPVLRQARAVLDSARKAAAGDHPVQERLDRIEVGLNYTELYYYERPGRRRLDGAECRCPVSKRRSRLMRQVFGAAERAGFTHWGERYSRYPTIQSLRRVWLESAGTHPALSLAGGGSRAVIVPHLGGRIVHYGPEGRAVNLLGEGSPKTFGFPCAGGYEEYSQGHHQTAGFCEPFAVVRRSRSEALLTAALDTGLQLERRVRLDGRTGALVVSSSLRNPHGVSLPGCLRAHLETDLKTPPGEVDLWFLRGKKWERLAGPPSGSWYGGDVPDGWALWSPTRGIGVRQTWSRRQVGAAFLGTIPSEPTVIALDLQHSRSNVAIPARGKQTLTHAVRWSEQAPGG